MIGEGSDEFWPICESPCKMWRTIEIEGPYKLDGSIRLVDKSYPWWQPTVPANPDNIKGTDPFFLPILVIIIIFFFMGENVSSGIWETCPKILWGYEYQNPPKWGLIYIYDCMYHIIIVIISKNIS